MSVLDGNPQGRVVFVLDRAHGDERLVFVARRDMLASVCERRHETNVAPRDRAVEWRHIGEAERSTVSDLDSTRAIEVYESIVNENIDIIWTYVDGEYTRTPDKERLR